MLAVISPTPSMPFTHDATHPTCPALTTALSAIASSEPTPVNATLEVDDNDNVGNTISETKSFAHGNGTSETICVVRGNFVRGSVVVVAVVGVCVDVCVAMDEV